MLDVSHKVLDAKNQTPEKNRRVEMDMQSKQTLLQQAGVVSGKNILDVGFRDVQELQEIASLVGPTGSVFGIDINPLNVQSASKKLASLSSNIYVKKGSVLEIPFEDCSFDLVLCKGVLHEIKQLEKAVAEMAS